MGDLLGGLFDGPHGLGQVGPRATSTSTSTRAQSRDSLPNRSISPLRTCHTIPSTARSRVVRSPTRSTTPLAGPALTTSPGPYWSSISMAMPDRKSRTICWALRLSTSPAMPAPASRGPS